MLLNDFISKLQSTPEQIEFDDCMAIIDQNYDFKPAAFTVGAQVNQAGQNQGSCKLMAFAQLQQLTESETLACFGHYYRKDVLSNPSGSDHQNIRQFMLTGWPGVRFTETPLRLRSS